MRADILFIHEPKLIGYRSYIAEWRLLRYPVSQARGNYIVINRF